MCCLGSRRNGEQKSLPSAESSEESLGSRSCCRAWSPAPADVTRPRTPGMRDSLNAGLSPCLPIPPGTAPEKGISGAGNGAGAGPGQATQLSQHRGSSTLPSRRVPGPARSGSSAEGTARGAAGPAGGGSRALPSAGSAPRLVGAVGAGGAASPGPAR